MLNHSELVVRHIFRILVHFPKEEYAITVIVILIVPGVYRIINYFPKIHGHYFKIWYNCSAHRFAYLFIIEISIKWKQPQKIFLQYSCSVTMINIVKKISVMENSWTKHLDCMFRWFLVTSTINILERIACYRITTRGCHRSFVKFC